MASETFVVATATMTSLNPARAIFCLQVNFTGATFEGATVTGNTQFKGSIVKDTGERTTPSKYEAKFAVSSESELVKTQLSSGTLAMSMRQFVQMLFYRFGCHSPRLRNLRVCQLLQSWIRVIYCPLKGTCALQTSRTLDCETIRGSSSARLHLGKGRPFTHFLDHSPLIISRSVPFA